MVGRPALWAGFCLLCATAESSDADASLSDAVPFAQAAVYVANLESIKLCEGAEFRKDDDTEEDADCENPREAILAWNYGLSNAWLHLNFTSDRSGALMDEVVALRGEIKEFLKEEDARTTDDYGQLMTNIRKAFEGKLGAWLAEQGDTALTDEQIVTLGWAARPRADIMSENEEKTVHNATVTLSNGLKMPVLGFGTWELEAQECGQAVLWALQAGYRHIDTAQSYKNEGQVGRAMKKSGVPREDIFLVTKLSEEGDYTTKRVVKVLEKSLKKFGTPYVDLFMLHGPGETPNKTLAAWRGMEELHKKGKVKALGVSNFDLDTLGDLFNEAKVPPVYVQNKVSVYDQEFVIDEDRVALVAYSVLNPYPGILEPLKDPHVLAIAKRYHRTPSQILHRWALQMGAAVIPRSRTKERIEENTQLFDFLLHEEDMTLLSALENLVRDNLDDILDPEAAERMALEAKLMAEQNSPEGEPGDDEMDLQVPKQPKGEDYWRKWARGETPKNEDAVGQLPPEDEGSAGEDAVGEDAAGGQQDESADDGSSDHWQEL